MAAATALAACVLTSCQTAEAPRAPAKTHEPKADISLSPASVKVAEQARVLVSVEHPEEVAVRFPAAGLPCNGLDVVQTGDVRSRGIDPGWLLTERTFVVRGFRPGAYTLGPVETALVPGQASGGEAEKLKTPTARLVVESALGTSSSLADLRPMAGPRELPPEPPAWLTWAGIAAGALAVVAAAALAVNRWAHRRYELRRAPPAPPAHEVALAELRKIRESGMLEDGRVSEYTDLVSDVLRRYLEARFELPAPDRTTEEFLDDIASAPVLDRARKQFLADYLARCDLVKFAAADPGRRELDVLYNESVSFVNGTASKAARAETGHVV